MGPSYNKKKAKKPFYQPPPGTNVEEKVAPSRYTSVHAAYRKRRGWVSRPKADEQVATTINEMLFAFNCHSLPSCRWPPSGQDRWIGSDPLCVVLLLSFRKIHLSHGPCTLIREPRQKKCRKPKL